MRNTSLLIISLILINVSYCQINVKSTDGFSIEGNIKANYEFSLEKLDKYVSQNLGDVTTINHMGQAKGIRKGVKAIPLKQVLSHINLLTDKPKELFSYYLMLVATDGYKAVLSWNEAANSNNFYIIIETDGISWRQSKDRIEILEVTDRSRGHILIKGLSRVVARKAE